MVEVCCAIIISERKMLAVQRGPQSSHPWKWEFPGGKIDAAETARQCIVREIEEELTIGIEIKDKLEPIEYDYGSKTINLIPFTCFNWSGQINLTEHIAMLWIGFEQWESLDWADADKELILKNKEQLKHLLSKKFK